MHSTISLLAGLQLAVTLLLAIFPYIYATPSRTVVQRDLPTGWSFIGCYTDSPANPALTGFWYTNSDGLIADDCVGFCNSEHFTYAGVETGTDCYCGNVLTPGTNNTLASDCSSICSGDPNQSCGGPNSLDLYQLGNTVPPQPVVVETVDSWYYLGCYSDASNARTLSGGQVSVMGGPYNNSVENCVTACTEANYTLAGVEFATQCWCGNTIQNGGVALDSSHCNLACSGNSSELCGGADSYILYWNSH